MIQTKSEVIINANLTKVFDISADIEKYPEFIPVYKEVKILERKGNTLIVQRIGIVNNKQVRWKSEIKINPYHSIEAVQLQGPLKGMKVVWQFERIDNEKTKIILIHYIVYKKIPILGKLITRFIIANIIKKIAEETLEAIKNRVEKDNYHSSKSDR
jgi:ribosome-associated toxin RatA of RatAB toxin-antitoxin module